MRRKTSNGDELELRKDEVSNILEPLDRWGTLNLDKWWKKNVYEFELGEEIEDKNDDELELFGQKEDDIVRTYL